MIIKGILDFFGSVLNFLFTNTIIPDFPQTVYDSVISYTQMIFDNISFLGFFVHVPILLLVFGLYLSVEIVVIIYKIVMWVIRKIPLSIN